MQKQGFVTIATGDERYFKMARTLLYSYRLTAENKLPFAIITDRENEYTKEFDDVVLLDKCTCTYIDKIMLLKKCPYEETIFVDADCVAYRDLNQYWNVFKNADDFSCLGENLTLDTQKRGWFNLAGAGKYKDEIKYIPNFHGGIYFIRSGAVCNKMYEICKEVIAHYEEYTFRSPKPADEPVIALAMAVCGCKIVRWRPEHFICYWNAKRLYADFTKRYLMYSTPWFKNQKDGMLLHWGNAYVPKVRYRFEEEKIIQEYQSRNNVNTLRFKLLYGGRLRLIALYLRKFFEKLEHRILE